MISTIQQEQSIKRLTLIYCAALGLIGLLLSGGEVWIQAEQSKQASYVVLLEEAERYRYNSNRIVRQAQVMAEAARWEPHLKELLDLREAFISSHQALKSGEILADLPPAVGARFLAGLGDIEPSYRSMLAAIETLRDPANTGGSPETVKAAQQIREAYLDFAPALSAVIADVFVRNTAQVRTIRLIQLGRLGSTLGLLILVGYIVFRPAIRRTQEAFQNLENTGLELAEARDQAIENERMKTAFLANMSHEIRTPLNGVIGMVEILLKTGLTGQQREFVRTIESSADALLHIVDGVLDLAKIEAGKLVLERQDFDLRNTVEDAIQQLAPHAREKGLEFITHIDRDVPAALIGDTARFSQVLINLVDNAIKYTEKGEIFLRVSSPSKTDSEAEILVTVCDSGIGLSPQEQRRLFVPFNQADLSLTRRFGGAGLGLAISKQLAAKMNGSVEVQSALGHGSTFSFKVRLDRQTNHRREADIPAVNPPSPEFPDLRILVVDDNQSSRGILHIQLVSAGVRCDCVTNAAEALDRLQEGAALHNPFNMVILDMQKPEVDGFALARRIRTLPASQDIRILLVTSLTGEQADHLNDSAIDACVTKPINQNQLLVLIRSLASGNRSALPAEESMKPQISDSRSSAAGARILVVEDNPTNQEIISLQLATFGCKPDVVSNGKEALERLRTIRFDLVLMDCQMPVMDGYQATRLIRAMDGTSGIPIIALTAHAMNGDRDKCLEAGMDDYIPKPAKEEELRRVIEDWLQRKGQRTFATIPAGEDQFDAPSIDRGVFEQICALANKHRDPGKLTELVNGFLSHTEREVEAMGRCLEEGDIPGTRDLAHSLRGSAVFYGALPLSCLCREIEMYLAEEDINSAKDVWELIRNEADRVREALEHEGAVRRHERSGELSWKEDH